MLQAHDALGYRPFQTQWASNRKHRLTSLELVGIPNRRGREAKSLNPFYLEQSKIEGWLKSQDPDIVEGFLFQRPAGLLIDGHRDRIFAADDMSIGHDITVRMNHEARTKTGRSTDLNHRRTQPGGIFRNTSWSSGPARVE